MSNKISGAPLLGFDGLFDHDMLEWDGNGLDVLGAAGLTSQAGQHALPGKGTTSPGKKPTIPGKGGALSTGKKALTKGPIAIRFAKEVSKPSPHKKALLAAERAGARAQRVAGKIVQAKARYDRAAKAGRHAARKPMVLGFVGDRVVLGVAAPARRTMTAKQKKAVEKHAKSVMVTAQAWKAAVDAAAKASASGKIASAFARKFSPLIAQKLAGKHVVLGGDVSFKDFTFLGVDASGLSPGDEGYDPSKEGASAQPPDGAATGPDGKGLFPGDPGYDPKTDPSSPQYAGPAAPAPAFRPGISPDGRVMSPNGDILYDPATDPDLTPLPQRDAMMGPDVAFETRQHVLDDSVVYDNSKGWPSDSVGSFNVFGGQGDGVLWTGGRAGSPFEHPVWASRRGTIGKAEGWNGGKASGGEWEEGMRGRENKDPYYQVPSLPAITWLVAALSGEYGWGPLVGNPEGILRGIQWATVDQKWFYQSRFAPHWLTAELDGNIAKSNKNIIDAHTKTWIAVQAAQLATIRERQERQDAADADLALAQTEGEAATVRADTAATTAASEADVAATQQATQHGQLDIEAQRQAQDIATQQAQLDLEWQRAQQAAAIQQQQAYPPEDYAPEDEEPFEPEMVPADEEAPPEDEDLYADPFADMLDDMEPEPEIQEGTI